jgi:hypothetical protein
MPEFSLWAEQAWIDGRWQADVLFDVDAHGLWAGITTGVHTPPAHARRLDGPVLPGQARCRWWMTPPRASRKRGRPRPI